MKSTWPWFSFFFSFPFFSANTLMAPNDCEILCDCNNGRPSFYCACKPAAATGTWDSRAVTVITLLPKLSNEHDIFVWLATRGLIENQVHCARCWQPFSLQMHNLSVDGFRWKITQCRTTKTVRKDSFFAQVSMKSISLIIDWWSTDCSRDYIMGELRISQRSKSYFVFAPLHVLCSHFVESETVIGYNAMRQFMLCWSTFQCFFLCLHMEPYTCSLNVFEYRWN